MKKHFLTLIVMFAFVGSAVFAQQDAPKATVEWKKTTYDFGKIPQGKPVTAEFEFTNSGKVPYVIASVTPSCGCTVADYPKEPIARKKGGTVKATYNAANVGSFHKTITVRANTETPELFLTIQGEVVTQ